jgi:hypothetical protein
MKNPKLAKVARIGAVVCSFGLIGVYVSCRASGGRGEERVPAVTPASAEPAAGAVAPNPEPQQDFFPGSKSAEVFPPPPPQPQQTQQAPAQTKRPIMPGSKSAPIMNPR